MADSAAQQIARPPACSLAEFCPVYRAQLFCKQRTDVGLRAKSLTHVGEFGRALLSDDLTVFDDVVTPSSVPGPSCFPDIADLLAPQFVLSFCVLCAKLVQTAPETQVSQLLATVLRSAQPRLAVTKYPVVFEICGLTHQGSCRLARDFKKW